MKQEILAPTDVIDEHLQIQVPAITKRYLGIRAVASMTP